jgi:hypothetical protein
MIMPTATTNTSTRETNSNSLFHSGLKELTMQSSSELRAVYDVMGVSRNRRS